MPITKLAKTLLLSLGLASATSMVCHSYAHAQPKDSKPAPAQPASSEVTSLYQTSSLLGDKDVLFKANALKINDRKNGLSLLAAAPDWKVYVFMPLSHRICSYSYNKYAGISKDTAGVTGGISLNTLPLKRGDKITISSIPAISCETSKSFEDKQTKELERGFAGPRFAKWGQLVVAQNAPMDKMPKQAKTILCRFYGIPEFNGQGFPLQFKYLDLTNELHTLLLTNEMKKAQVDGNTFIVPRDYKTVSDASKLDDRARIKDNGPVKAIEILKKGHKVN